jgi:phosphoribosyl-ATP pyrophosphohydrolase/phosphoribosyl-AMP cyclohydrolase
MTGFTDAEALGETFKRGNVCFHSRSRNKLWMKGETSGSILKLVRMRADCDKDALLAVAEPVGHVCHTGAWSCFETGRKFTWEFLQSIIVERFKNPPLGSYTATLDDKLVREKLMEEAEEVCTAKTHDEVVWEAADLLYFATVLITREGLTVQEVLDELDRRHKTRRANNEQVLEQPRKKYLSLCSRRAAKGQKVYQAQHKRKPVYAFTKSD